MRIIWQTKLNPITQILYIVIYWFGFSILNIFQQIHSLKTKIKKLSPNSWGKSCSSCTSLRYNYLIALAANEISLFQITRFGWLSSACYCCRFWDSFYSPSVVFSILESAVSPLLSACFGSMLPYPTDWSSSDFAGCCPLNVRGWFSAPDLVLSRLNCWLKALFAFRRFSLLWSYCLLFWFSRQGFNYVL